MNVGVGPAGGGEGVGEMLKVRGAVEVFGPPGARIAAVEVGAESEDVAPAGGLFDVLDMAEEVGDARALDGRIGSEKRREEIDADEAVGVGEGADLVIGEDVQPGNLLAGEEGASGWSGEAILGFFVVFMTVQNAASLRWETSCTAPRRSISARSWCPSAVTSSPEESPPDQMLPHRQASDTMRTPAL